MQDMHRSQIPLAVALVYNWWSWYVRAANPTVSREALTSRLLLLAAVGRADSHADQTVLLNRIPLRGRQVMGPVPSECP